MHPGAAFGDYRTVKRLGSGTSGEVWLLEIGEDRRNCAVKILSPELARKHASRSRFLHEALVAMELRHPNLLKVYDIGEDPSTGLCYMLMEYAPGGTLAERIAREGSIPLPEALATTRALADLLVLTARHRIVHRDIKPGNILLGAQGEPKLSDFGIVRTAAGSDNRRGEPMLGTIAYMAPEQMINPDAADIRSDIYSLGIVFFEMLAGRRPREDKDAMEFVARSVSGGDVPDIREFCPAIPGPVSGIIGAMCAADPDSRVRSPEALVSLLDWAAREVV